MTNPDEQLEERLGRGFQNPELLRRALTHSSAIPELRGIDAADVPPPENNEQLEFLGDAVLDLLASEYLVEKFPKWTEGQLSKSRARLVNAQALELAARRLRLGEHLRLGRGEEKTGGREKPALLADAFEALIGAIYLDGGLEKTRKFILAQAQQDLAQLAEEPVDINPKGYLQELLQSISPRSPVYEVLSQTGPEHDKRFVVQAVWEGIVLGKGRGRSKKQAETAAAEEAMELKRWKKAKRPAKIDKKKKKL